MRRAKSPAQQKESTPQAARYVKSCGLKSAGAPPVYGTAWTNFPWAALDADLSKAIFYGRVRFSLQLCLFAKHPLEHAEGAFLMPCRKMSLHMITTK